MTNTDHFVSFIKQRTKLPESTIRAGLRSTDELKTEEAEDTFVSVLKDKNALVQIERAMGMIAMVDPNCEAARSKLYEHPGEVRKQTFPMVRDIEAKMREDHGIHVRALPSIVREGGSPSQAEQILFSAPGQGMQVAVGHIFMDSTPGEQGELWFFAPADNQNA